MDILKSWSTYLLPDGPDEEPREGHDTALGHPPRTLHHNEVLTTATLSHFISKDDKNKKNWLSKQGPVWQIP